MSSCAAITATFILSCLATLALPDKLRVPKIRRVRRRPFPAPSPASKPMAVKEQAQVVTQIATRPDHGPAMTDQPNQNCPEENPDPTHLHSVDGSDATDANTTKDVPAEPGTSNDTDDLSRKVMSPETENCMK